MQNDEILVSICCLTYNHAPYIKETLKGFLKQKVNFNYEILIYDDASTDGTTNVLKEFQRKYPNKVQLYIPEENQFSKGIFRMIHRFLLPIAKGKYIALCEGDDYWIDENKLQKQIDILEKDENISCCVHAAQYINVEGKKLPDSLQSYLYPLGCNKVFDFDSGAYLFFPTASKIYRKNAIKMKLPNWYYIGEAGDFIEQLLLLDVGNFYYIDEKLSAYRFMTPDGSNSRLKKCGIEEIERYYDERLYIYKEFDKYTGFRHHNKCVEMIYRTKVSKIQKVSENNLLERYKKVSLLNQKYGDKIENCIVLKNTARCLFPQFYSAVTKLKYLVKNTCRG